MLRSFRIARPVARNSNVEPEDARNAQSALAALGVLDLPDGATSFPTLELIEGVQRFQKAKGLKVDGVMKPGGETEAAVDRALNLKAEARARNDARNRRRDSDRARSQDGPERRDTPDSLIGFPQRPARTVAGGRDNAGADVAEAAASGGAAARASAPAPSGPASPDARPRVPMVRRPNLLTDPPATSRKFGRDRPAGLRDATAPDDGLRGGGETNAEDGAEDAEGFDLVAGEGLDSGSLRERRIADMKDRASDFSAASGIPATVDPSGRSVLFAGDSRDGHGFRLNLDLAEEVFELDPNGERIAVMGQVLSGEITEPEALQRLRQFFPDLPADPSGGENVGIGISARAPELLPRDNVEGALDILAAVRNGELSQEDATVLLTPLMYPEIERDETLRGLLLDMIPIVGNVRSGIAAVEDLRAMAAALEQGDWAGFAANGGLFLVDAAGAVGAAMPFARPVFRIMRRKVWPRLWKTEADPDERFLRNTPFPNETRDEFMDRLAARQVDRKRSRNPSLEELYAPGWYYRLSKADRAAIQKHQSKFFGKATESYFKRRMKIYFKNTDQEIFPNPLVAQTKRKDPSNPDFLLARGEPAIRLKVDVALEKVLKAPEIKGVIAEIKSGRSNLTRAQRDVRKQMGPEAFRTLSVPFHEVPADTIQSAFASKNINISERVARRIVANLRGELPENAPLWLAIDVAARAAAVLVSPEEGMRP